MIVANLTAVCTGIAAGPLHAAGVLQQSHAGAVAAPLTAAAGALQSPSALLEQNPSRALGFNTQFIKLVIGLDGCVSGQMICMKLYAFDSGKPEVCNCCAVPHPEGAGARIARLPDRCCLNPTS